MSIYPKNIKEYIDKNPYPGRGIVVGKTPSGKLAVAYFIMGRSQNSRNRVLNVLPSGHVYTEPFDFSKVEDPTLIIYRALATVRHHLIVTNGDQTDTIYRELEAGGCSRKALKTREFEPDAPNFTPRISGVVTWEDGDFSYEISILKSADREGSACNRYFYSYASLAGRGHFIHTYEGDGNPLPTFEGEPRCVVIPEDIDQFADEIWNNLDAENKIAMYVLYADGEDGKVENRIFNKNTK